MARPGELAATGIVSKARRLERDAARRFIEAQAHDDVG